MLGHPFNLTILDPVIDRPEVNRITIGLGSFIISSTRLLHKLVEAGPNSSHIFGRTIAAQLRIIGLASLIKSLKRSRTVMISGLGWHFDTIIFGGLNECATLFYV